MSVRVYSSFDELSDDAIDRLSYRNRRNIFNSLEWFRCLVGGKIFDGQAPRIYAAGDGDKADCFLFLVADTATRTLSSMTNFYTMEFWPVFVDENSSDPARVSEIFDYIANETPSWETINLRLVYEGSAESGQILEGLAGAGFQGSPYFMFENFFEKTEGISFADYYGNRSSRVKNTIKRREKKLAKSHEFSIRILRDFDDGLVDDYDSVYANSWKDPEQFPDFIREMCRMCATLGILRMGVLYVDGAPVAAQLWIISGRKAVIYKLAYDEAFREFSVGSILTRDMLDHVLENDDVAEIDYGVGSENYKKDWMDQTRTLIGIEAFNRRTIAGKFRILKSRAGKLLKKKAA